MTDLKTVDIDGVDILKAGVTVHGIGSPPEGDVWSTEDLKRIAKANNELAELKPANKIGHHKGQRMLGDEPSFGWLTNFRVSKDGERLLTDVKKVPQKIAGLLKVGAYRTRSVEVGPYKSQADSTKTYPWVVKGLAWLGSQMPAVKTLDDVVKLYHDDGLELELNAGDQIIAYAAAPEWDSREGYNWLRSAIEDSLNPGPGALEIPGEMRWHTLDVKADSALVRRGWGEHRETFIVPFTITDGAIVPAAAAQWTKVVQEWIADDAISTQGDSSVTRANSGVDTQVVNVEITPDQDRQLREKLGLAADAEITPDVLLEAAVAAAPAAPDAGDEDAAGDADSAATPPVADADAPTARERELSARLEAQEKKTHEREKEIAITAALSSGRILPAKRADYERMYDDNAEACTSALALLEPNEELAREYGAEEPGEGDSQTASQFGDLADDDKFYAASAASRLGVDPETVI